MNASKLMLVAAVAAGLCLSAQAQNNNQGQGRGQGRGQGGGQGGGQEGASLTPHSSVSA